MRGSRQTIYYSFICDVLNFRIALASRLFPIIGFRIITELSSPEDLPRLESDELSNKRLTSVFSAELASLSFGGYAATLRLRFLGAGAATGFTSTASSGSGRQRYRPQLPQTWLT